MRNKLLRSTLLLLVLLLVPLTALAHDEETCGLVSLFDAWAPPAAAGMSNGTVFRLLVNLSSEADTLVSATTLVASAVEFHQTTMGNGDVMQMRPVEAGIPVPAGGTARLQSGGFQVMLIGLKEELLPATMLDLTLTFEHADAIEVAVPVQEPAEEPMLMGG